MMMMCSCRWIILFLHFLIYLAWWWLICAADTRSCCCIFCNKRRVSTYCVLSIACSTATGGGVIPHLKVTWRRLCPSVVGCGLRLTEVYRERYSTFAISTRKWVFGSFYFELSEWFFFVSFFAKELDMACSETLLCPLETVWRASDSFRVGSLLWALFLQIVQFTINFGRNGRKVCCIINTVELEVSLNST